MVLPAASRAVTTIVCGPMSSGPVASAPPLRIGRPRSVAMQLTTVLSSSHENETVAAVPTGTFAPSSGEATVIVGATGSATPLSSSA